jgi:hypothetical protein
VQVLSFVKVFPKVCHGWTSHYGKNNPEVVANANKAHSNTPDWYANKLPVIITTTTTTKATALETVLCVY